MDGAAWLGFRQHSVARLEWNRIFGKVIQGETWLTCLLFRRDSSFLAVQTITLLHIKLN